MSLSDSIGKIRCALNDDFSCGDTFLLHALYLESLLLQMFSSGLLPVF